MLLASLCPSKRLRLLFISLVCFPPEAGYRFGLQQPQLQLVRAMSTLVDSEGLTIPALTLTRKESEMDDWDILGLTI